MDLSRKLSTLFLDIHINNLEKPILLLYRIEIHFALFLSYFFYVTLIADKQKNRGKKK